VIKFNFKKGHAAYRPPHRDLGEFIDWSGAIDYGC